MKPFSKSRMFVSLCHLSPLPLVEPILENDVQFYFIFLYEFVNAYKEGNRVLYVSSFSQDGNTMDVGDADTWGEHWQKN